MATFILLAASLAALAAGPAQFAPFPVEVTASGKPVAIPTLRLGEGRTALAMGRGRDERNIVEEADAIVHRPTDVRLPRVHQGCRLAAVLPLPGDREAYARGALAEYDCTPSEALTHVEVSFETGVDRLAGKHGALELAKVADRINEGLTNTDRSLCVAPSPSTHPAQAGLTITQCSARRLDRRDPNRRTYGAATVVFGRGSSFIRFSRKCVDEQCQASLAPFAHFFDTLDLRRFSEKAAETAPPQ